MSNLILYDEAKRAVAACKNRDEASEIEDKMAALEVYGRQIHDPQLESDAAEIRQRAMRRYEALTTEMRKAGLLPGGKGGRPTKAQRENPTPRGGVSKSEKEKTKRRTLAAIPEPEFEQAIAEQRDEGRVPTVNGTIRRATNSKLSNEDKARNQSIKILNDLISALRLVDRSIGLLEQRHVENAPQETIDRLLEWYHEYAERKPPSIGRWLQSINLTRGRRDDEQESA